MLSDFLFALLAVMTYKPLATEARSWPKQCHMLISHAMSAGASLTGPGCQKRRHFGGCCTSTASSVKPYRLVKLATAPQRSRCHDCDNVSKDAPAVVLLLLGAQQQFLQIQNSHLITEGFRLYRTRRLLVKLALLYKFCLILAAGSFQG